MSLSSLSKCIVPSQRMVNIMKWKSIKRKAILSLDISETRIGVAYSKSDSHTNAIYPLEPIEYMQRHTIMMTGITKTTTKRSDKNKLVREQIEKLVQKHNVCGFLISWPLQPNGRMGLACGKALYMLDVLAGGDRPLVTKNRPFVLWDDIDILSNKLKAQKLNDRDNANDKWGRSPIFSRVPSPTMTEYTSRDQYDHQFTTDSTGASIILKTFMDAHFTPAVKAADEYERLYMRDDSSQSNYNAVEWGEDDIDDFESSGAYIQANLL